MPDLSLTTLTEKPEDAAAIERLHERTFGPGRYVRTSERIRAAPLISHTQKSTPSTGTLT